MDILYESAVSLVPHFLIHTRLPITEFQWTKPLFLAKEGNAKHGILGNGCVINAMPF